MPFSHCRLGVNVDHVATLRQARKAAYPDPVIAASLAEVGGADQITIHLRADRRHIQDRDVRLHKDTCQTLLNLEIAATEEMLGIALDIHPDAVTLVPEREGEVTTEGGLNVVSEEANLKVAIRRLQERGIIVSLFVDADPKQIDATVRAGATRIEIHTGHYAEARGEERERQLARIREASKLAHQAGLEVAAGHGLNYANVLPIAGIPEMQELNIGHAIVARSILVGMEKAVREMVELIHKARG